MSKHNSDDENSSRTPGFLVLKSFALKHAAANKSKVHVLSYESSCRDLNLPPQVQVHRAFQDPLGWISGNDQSKLSLLEDLDQLLGKQEEDVILIVDSLNHLLHQSDLCRDINKLVNQRGSTNVKQLVAILHEDVVPAEAKPEVRSLLNICRTHIDMLEPSKISVLHKKNSGKILSEVNKIVWDKDQGWLESTLATDSAPDFLLPAPSAQAEPLSTFSLTLNPTEKEARDALVLPYMESGRGLESSGRGLTGSGGGGVIYVEPDDYDEEDPDDDLDV